MLLRPDLLEVASQKGLVGNDLPQVFQPGGVRGLRNPEFQVAAVVVFLMEVLHRALPVALRNSCCG